jgi:hypothetical protein
MAAAASGCNPNGTGGESLPPTQAIKCTGFLPQQLARLKERLPTILRMKPYGCKVVMWSLNVELAQVKVL